MKKIVFITPNFSNGGAERVTALLANAFNNRGDKVAVIYMKDDISVYPLEAGIKQLKLFDKKKDKFSVLRKVLRLRAFMKKHKDVSYVAMLPYETFYAFIASFGMKRNITYSLRNDPYSQKSKMHSFINKVIYPSATRIVFQTEDARAYYPEKVQKKGSIIVNPVTMPDYPPFEGTRAKEFVTVGRLTLQKNYPLLLKAFAKVHERYDDWKLKIYGQGELEAELRELADSLNINDAVAFCGFVDNVKERIYESGCFVLSSDYEGISNAMLEALSLGVPCICTDCPIGGARLMITDHENGLLVPVRDEKKLVEAMCYVIENPDAVQEFSKSSVERCKELSPESIMEQWRNVL